MRADRNAALMTGAASSALAAALHLGCIIFGAPWYRFFGAGERMAQLSLAGSWYPVVVTTAIAAVLATWSIYALSGAGVIRRASVLAHRSVHHHRYLLAARHDHPAVHEPFS